MQSRVAIGTSWGIIWLLLLWPPMAAAQTGTSRQRLIGASNDAILWIVVGEWNGGEKTYLNWLSYLDRSSAQAHPVIGIRPQKGRVIRSVVVGENLHLFYESGAHHRYTRAGEGRELRLPGQVLPEAIAGESEGKIPRLWAVVKDETAQQVARAWATSTLRTTQPDSESAPPSPETQPAFVGRDANALHLVQYNGAEWEPGFAATPIDAGSERIWLCIAGDRFHLFWQKSKQDTNIQYAWYQRGQWTRGPEIGLSHAPQEAVANVINRQLVFTALIPSHNDPQQLRCESWLRQPQAGKTGESDHWNPLPTPKTKDGKAVTLPMGSAAVAFADNNLVILRMGEKEAEMGFWSLTRGEPEQPEQPFRTIPLRKKGGEPETQRGVREFATTMIVAMILLLVFWRRQGNFSTGVSLPSEFIIARPGKRALAAAIDLAPALAVATWWWYAPLMEFMDDVGRVPDQIEAWPQELFWMGVWFRIMYTGYCMAFELLAARTPGKWLTGCSVWSESLTAPTPLQIVIRNLTRLIEFEPHLLIWPFMLVIFFTRDRQRIGDLLARTIVVERNPNIIDLGEGSEDKIEE